MPGNSERRGRRTASKKGAAGGSGGKNRESLKGRGKTLPADERPVAQGHTPAPKMLPQRTAWKQDKERRAAAAEGRAPKVGTPGSQGHHVGRRPACRHQGAAASAAPQPARGRGGGAPVTWRSAGGPRTPLDAREGRSGAAGRPQPGARGAALAHPGDRALRGSGHRDRRPDQRDRPHRGRPWHRRCSRSAAPNSTG